MFDNLNAPNGREPGRHEGGVRQPAAEPLTDREVPLSISRTPASVQAWLDGEAAESTLQGADARHVEFWSRVNEETARRREMRTPVEVQQRIMAALPMATPQAVAPWYRRNVTVNPAVAIAAAASLVAIGAAVGVALRPR
ncbi:MAG TPA: hypothetical protein VFJ74_11905 [Gemmatimonadaceae bacterium]|nr:hypothetical protein [Gemmatimonadaceae bacterium]